MSFDLKKDPWYIRVNSPEESAAVQEWLFEQGITWWRNYSVVQYTFSRYLTNSYSSGVVEPYLMYGTVEIDKFLDQRKELKVIFEKVLQVEKVITPPQIREKLEVVGKQYYKEDVEKALQLLKPIN
jgi:hypothetical protein